jgi:hypothetical protein
MESVKIFSIEDVEIDVSTIINEIKENRQLGQRKVEEKVLKSYIKNGVVQFQNEQGDWEELENDNKEKLDEIVKILKNISSEKVEKPKKTKKIEKESNDEKNETEEIKPKTKKQTKKQTKKTEETETDNSINEKVEKPKKTKKQAKKEVDVEGIEEKVKIHVENKIKEKLNELVDQIVKDVMIEIKKNDLSIQKTTVNQVNNLGDQLKNLVLENYEKTEEHSEILDKDCFDDLNELECSIDLTE